MTPIFLSPPALRKAWISSSTAWARGGGIRPGPPGRDPHTPRPIYPLRDAAGLADQRVGVPPQLAAPLDLAIHPPPPHDPAARVFRRSQSAAPAARRRHIEPGR